MYVSLNEASKLTNKSKSVISGMINRKKNPISHKNIGTKDSPKYEIDTSELKRFFDISDADIEDFKSKKEKNRTPKRTPRRTPKRTPGDDDNVRAWSNTEELKHRKEIEGLKRDNENMKQEIKNLTEQKEMIDKNCDDLRNAMRMLDAPRNTPSKAPSNGFFSKLISKFN